VSNPGEDLFDARPTTFPDAILSDEPVRPIVISAPPRSKVGVAARRLPFGSLNVLNTFRFTFRQSGFAEMMLHGDAMQMRNTSRNTLRRAPAAGAWCS